MLGRQPLPLTVLEEIQDSGFLDFGGSGMSVTEVSHRSKWFDDVINDTIDELQTNPATWMTGSMCSFCRVAPACSFA
jgi:hypothetical protein